MRTPGEMGITASFFLSKCLRGRPRRTGTLRGRSKNTTNDAPSHSLGVVGPIVVRYRLVRKGPLGVQCSRFSILYNQAPKKSINTEESFGGVQRFPSGERLLPSNKRDP